MKRILYLSRGGNIGGSQKQLEYLVSDIQQNFEPVVVCISKGPFLDGLLALGITARVMTLRPWRKLINALARYRDTRRLLRFARRNQIALIHGSDLWLSQYLLRAGRKLGVPTILHVRTPVSPKEVRKHRITEATAVVAISQRVRRNLIDAGVAAQRITLIDDAIDLDVFRPDQTGNDVLRRDFPHSQRFQIGLVGHIRPAKKHLEFLRAIEHLCRTTNCNATFFFIGGVHSQNYLEELQRFINAHNLKDRVIFTGDRRDMPDVLNALDLLVSLSGGSVMFEGMACGKCVISAGFTAKEYAVHLRDGETGILLDSNHPEILSSTLKSLLQNPQLRNTMGSQARRWVETKLDRRQMAASVQRLYAELLFPSQAMPSSACQPRPATQNPSDLPWLQAPTDK